MVKEFIDKLIARLELAKKTALVNVKNPVPIVFKCDLQEYTDLCFDEAIEIVNQLAEEYKDKVIIDGQYCWQTCGATEHCKECNRLCNGSIDYYENYDVLAEEYNNGWVPCNDQLPPHSDDLLLVQCNGKPRNNINFVNAFCLASYTEEGWTLEMYPDWRDAEVVAWKNLGEPYQPKGE